MAGSKETFGMAAIPGGDATKAEVHSRKRIDELLFAQRNLLHKCATITRMTPPCSYLCRPNEIDEYFGGDEGGQEPARGEGGAGQA